MRLLSALTVYAVLHVILTESIDDPYKVLGISRRATQKEVKGAYKALAKEWHPDKNSSPEAHEMFMKITKAYETLSDPMKRERFDKFGTFDESPRHERSRGDGFDQFFGFRYGGFEDGFFATHRISLRVFTHSIMDRSDEKPFIIYVYSNYCQLCFSLQRVWKAAVNDLEPLGYGVATVNAMIDGNLVEKLRISHLPSIVAVVEGRIIPMRHPMHELSDRAIRKFAQKVIPDYYMTKIGSLSALKRFVEQWRSTNRVSVVVVGAAKEPRTRYLIAAMKYSHFAKFAYVSLVDATEDVQILRSALDIKCNTCENIFIYNDFEHDDAVARLTISHANQLKKEALDDFIEKNKLLTLPRLSSMEVFDAICPVSSRHPRHLCVVLPVTSAKSEEEHVNAFREYVKENGKKWALKNVHFAYIFTDKQDEWMKPFIEKRFGEVRDFGKDLLIFWRMEYVKAKFTWMKNAWKGRKQETDNELLSFVEMRRKLEETGRVQNLKNEYSLSLFTRWSRAMWRTMETVWFYMTHEEMYMILSAVCTLGLILGIGWVLSYLNENGDKPKAKKFKPNDVADASADNEWHPEDPKIKKEKAPMSAEVKANRIMSIMKPLMHELRAETYFGMIRLLKPGCRSFILLVDEDNKEKLLHQFAQYIFPIRNNKTFSFGYLVIPKNLDWFRKLLEHTLPGETDKTGESTLYQRLKSINPRQCIGTVLTLCGWKLYFSIYHPRHVEASRRNFVGTDENSSSSDDDDDSYRNDEFASMGEKKKLHWTSSQISVENVLDGFPNWLDRLLEGSIRRYYIPEWPDNLK